MPEAPHPKSRNISAAVVPQCGGAREKGGQPARPTVVISAGTSEHETITIARRRRTPQLKARHLLSAPANASDLSSSKLIFDVCRSPSDLLLRVPTTNSEHQQAELCATALRPTRSKRLMTENGTAQTGTVPVEQPRMVRWRMPN